jgi:hypothetical protein
MILVNREIVWNHFEHIEILVIPARLNSAKKLEKKPLSATSHIMTEKVCQSGMIPLSEMPRSRGRKREGIFLTQQLKGTRAG